MTLKTLGPQSAAQLDKELMSEEGGYSIDQLMELAGLSVSQAIYTAHPPSKGKKVLLACGPGNNGGDGLVAARHLFHYGYQPTVFYPKPTKQPIFEGLQKQLKGLKIPFTDDFDGDIKKTDLVVDALFGFSFRPPVRAPFDTVIQGMIDSKVPVLAVDIPSCWDVEGGPPAQGEVGSDFMPEYLISLTAAKPCVSHFKGQRHFIGGRFLSQDFAGKFGLDVPEYKGIDQIAEVQVGAKVEKL
jgi:NAD(P)H-hydrate epimerase